MARLEKNDYSILSSKDIQDPILFVVDMINGFVKEGPLHDHAIAKTIEPIQKLIQTLDCETIFVQDAHDPKAAEFSSYPVHCIKDSRESMIVDELQSYASKTILKNSTNTFTSPGFQNNLCQLSKFKDIVITGCCTDLCILQFALCLKGWLNEHNSTQRIIIPVDCVETYDISQVHDAKAWNSFALKNMEMNGIKIVKYIEEEKA